MKGTSGFATAAVTAMTLVTGISLVRVFDTPSFLLPVLGATLAAHVLAALTRRRPFWVAVPTMVLGGGLVGILAARPGATTFGLPTPATFTAIRLDLDAALTTLREASAPVPPEAGTILVAVLGLWFAAWSADRLDRVHRAPVEAVVPSATMFLIVTALAGDQQRWWPAGLYAATVALHLLTARHLTSGRAARSDRAAWRSVVGGLAVAAVAVLAGLGAAATLPVLHFEGANPIRSEQAIEVTPPLIDLGDLLVNPSDEELFQTRGGGAHYWRLTAYDTFDGARWRMSRSTSSQIHGPLMDGPDPDAADTVTTAFHLTNLGGTFAPAAQWPSRLVEGPDRVGEPGAPTMRWDGQNQALVVGGQDGGVADLAYTVQSRIPTVDPVVLAAADADPPAEIRRYTELPTRVRARLAPIARTVTGSANAPYDIAMALQNHFRDEYAYATDLTGLYPSPQAAAGQSTDAIDAFLEIRVGYCVHFAGTFAALARASGLPARVAVGFTPGEAMPDGTDGRIVRGRNAHVWPEVYFTGVGWIPFEPSPGRGNPDAADYTGVDGVDDPHRVGGYAVDPSGTPSTTAAPTTTRTPTTTAPSKTPETDGASASAPERTPGRSTWDPRWLLVGIPPVAGAALAVLRVLGAARRRRAADTPARGVRLAWADTLDAWYALDLRRGPTDTDRDLADRLGRRLQALAEPAGTVQDAATLGRFATVAAWRPDQVSPDDLAGCRAAADRLIAAARRRRPRWRRMLDRFDPRYHGGER